MFNSRFQIVAPNTGPDYTNDAPTFDITKPIPHNQDTRKNYWCFTCWDYDTFESRYCPLYQGGYRGKVTRIEGFKYIIIGLERSPTSGQKHIQGYVEFEARTRPAAIAHRLGVDPNKCRYFERLGTITEAIDYCRKPYGEFFKFNKKTGQPYDPKNLIHWFELGDHTPDITLPNQPPLVKLTTLISNGATFRIINQQMPGLALTHNKRLRDQKLLIDKNRTIPREVIIEIRFGNKYWVNKSKLPAEDVFYPRGIYWDSYDSEKTLIFSDFGDGASTIKWEVFKEIFSGHPTQVAFKNQSGIWAAWELIIILSHLHPFDWYPDIPDNDKEFFWDTMRHGNGNTCRKYLAPVTDGINTTMPDPQPQIVSAEYYKEYKRIQTEKKAMFEVGKVNDKKGMPEVIAASLREPTKPENKQPPTKTSETKLKVSWAPEPISEKKEKKTTESPSEDDDLTPEQLQQLDEEERQLQEKEDKRYQEMKAIFQSIEPPIELPVSAVILQYHEDFKHIPMKQCKWIELADRLNAELE